uniref:Peptidase M61 catalytic domain-containing protein n=1 Tax=Talaromyces marneffei PM1 TaxID=1077442 RepID=A0A093V2Y7_TALMA
MAALNLKLRPLFRNDGVAQALDVTMVFDTAGKKQDEVVFNHTLMRAVVPTMQYTAESIQLTNSNNSAIGLYTVDTKRNTYREFRVEQDVPAGERLTVKYQATPRHVNESTRCGPQVAIEEENGGLSGAGLAFLLIPATGDGDILHDIVIEWDLSSAPSTTRAVCTFGEGQGVSVRERPSILSECFFAAGPLKSYPPVVETTPSAPSATSLSPFGMYWLSDPPFDTSSLGQQLEKLIPRMADFFGDDDRLFRIFIRRNEYKCASGRGLHRGFVFAWTPLSPKAEDMVQDFLMHEIVHNWPRLGFTTGGPEDLIDGWFNEGIAEYYSLILPFVFGVMTEEQFIERFNWRISGYYTNPDRAVKNKDVQDRFWLPGQVNRIPYQRGFMYFVQLAYKLHNSGKRSLDELMREMIKLRATDKPHGIRVWLSFVERELGSPALDDYKEMSEAKPIILPSDVAKVWIPNSNWKLEPVRQEEFYLGFPEENFSAQPRVIAGLDLESRAAKVGGLQEGDQITLKYGFLVDADVWPKMFTMNVKRGNEEMPHQITWWPRSWYKVESYQFVRSA